MRKAGLVVALASAILVCVSGCGGVTVKALEVSSDAFGQGEPIPAVHTCDGDDLSPPLSWSDPPEGTVSLAVIMDDPDARGWVHWVIFDLPADARGLATGIPQDAARPAGGIQGSGNSGAGYHGPCPPRRRGAHRYSFRVYALDSRLELPEGASKAQVVQAMEGHILAEGELIGIYERP
jgi:Raf kinase inhibitor-like YbhB/YbcL family protein